MKKLIALFVAMITIVMTISVSIAEENNTVRLPVIDGKICGYCIKKQISP